MKSLGQFLGSKTPNISSSSLSAADETAALQDAMVAVTHMLNDDFERAEAELSQGNSPFHKLGKGVVSFLQAALGFEQETMKEASHLLSEAESAASEHQRKAYKDGYRSAIYPPGSEYALCYAESQLMAAVVGILNESLTEAIRGFYKIRRAYATLQEIADAEKRYLKTRSDASVMSSSRQSTDSRRSTRSTSKHLSPNMAGPAPSSTDASGLSSPWAKSPSPLRDDVDDEDSDLDFVDADEDLDPSQSSNTYGGHLDSPFDRQMDKLTMSPMTSANPNIIPASDLTNTIDLFVHTGTSLCFGILQLLLALIPPAFSRLLAIVGFRGDRETGLAMLWSATQHPENINGALAGLIVLGYYSNMVNFCDILLTTSYPRQECRSLLLKMRELYPRSRFWMLEEARMMASERQPEEALRLLTTEGTLSPLKQVEALRWFESSLNWMYTGQWEKCAEGMIKCVDLNNWSHGLYLYIAASCYIEMYRIQSGSKDERSESLAAKYKSRATELLNTVPSKSGKKRFMARQLPFDVYVCRKHAKWEAKAKQRGCDMVDATGVSPIQEMIYFWNGYKRMAPKHTEYALERVEASKLRWQAAADGGGGNDWEQSVEKDELLAYYVLKATVLSRLGRRSEAREILDAKLINVDLAAFKAQVGPQGESWVLPVANYEMAVLEWEDHLDLTDRLGKAAGQRSQEEKEKAESTLKGCGKYIDKVTRWEAYDLDARVGVKVRAAQETLKKREALVEWRTGT